MTVEALANHLECPVGRGHTPTDAFTGAAGGAACGDLVRMSLALDPESPDGRIADAGFDAHGCGAAIAAGSATVSLVRGVPLLAAARVGTAEIATELGGLSPTKRHAAELAADALHRALGAAARSRARLAPTARRTVVAMSGGVDSAVAAMLTAQEGEDVVGVTLELWSDPENDGERSCCSAQAVRGARALAHSLGMPHLSIDLRAEFQAGVVDHWLSDYKNGLTPNPCVHCNGNVRLDAMLQLGRNLGSRWLVTGHYARVHEDADGQLLRMARDPTKDQTYVLAGLRPCSLARLRFPLGNMRKTNVRELAARAGLAVASKPDSQDLCFLAGTGLSRFLDRHGGVSRRPGSILDLGGVELGSHPGAHSFTIGQRHGLGLGGRDPLYVLRTDTFANTVTVGPRERLLTSSLTVRDVTLRRPGAGIDGVRIRSRGQRFPCRLEQDLGPGEHPRIEVRLREPIERTAPGQIACLYAGDLILGYGAISA
jgi:tRNA-uridine 2-sulfurtransferase